MKKTTPISPAPANTLKVRTGVRAGIATINPTGNIGGGDFLLR